MKKYLLIIALALFGLSACVKQIEIEQTGDTLLTRSSVDSLAYTPELAYPGETGELVTYIIDDEEVIFEKFGDYLVLEGDMIFLESDFLPATRGVGVALKKEKWLDNIVYYSLDPGLNNNQRTWINEAIAWWEQSTYISFIQRTTQKDYVKFISIDGNVSWSYVGRISGMQEIKVGTKASKGTVAHEIGHAMGLMHEHSRRDRDDYITIHSNNIEDGMRRYFNKVNKSRVNYGPFDFQSIMLYGSYDFAKGSDQPSITKKDGTKFSANRAYLSAGDISTIRQMYPLENAGFTACPADYDGDGKTDISLKDNNGKWYIDYAWNGFGTWDWIRSGYGGTSYIPVPADYDGDGKADLSVKCGNGHWIIDYASNGYGQLDWQAFDVGDASYIPAIGDFDGDGKADLSLKSSNGHWKIDYASNGFQGFVPLEWQAFDVGDWSYVPVIGDFDGDGKDDLSLKSSNGHWKIDYASNGFQGFVPLEWQAFDVGGASYIPAAGDFDGDGKADLSLKSSNGHWKIDYASNGFQGFVPLEWQAFDQGGYAPIVGDFDGDGKDDLCIITPDMLVRIDFAANGFNGWDRYVSY